MTLSKSRVGNVRWRTIVLPTEHGSWAFVSEPIILGMLLVPSWGGLAFCIAIFAAFLLRQPLKIYLKDVKHHRQVPRTAVARQFSFIFSSILIVASLSLWLTSPDLKMLVPVFFALPLIVIQFIADLRNNSRSLYAELASSFATGAVASALVLIGGWLYLPAFGLWLALGGKAVTSVLYVRARLRLERNQSTYRLFAVTSHAVVLALLTIATLFEVVPWTVPVTMLVLFVRATVGLSSVRKIRQPKEIGIQEIGYGLGYVVMIAIGYNISSIPIFPS